MEKEPLGPGQLCELPVASKIPIGLVADNRQAPLGALHPKLVAPPGAGFKADERESRLPVPVAHDAHLALRGDMTAVRRGPDLSAALLHRQQIAPELNRLAGHAKDDGLVDLAHLLAFELRANIRGERRSGGGQNHAGTSPNPAG